MADAAKKDVDVKKETPAKSEAGAKKFDAMTALTFGSTLINLAALGALGFFVRQMSTQVKGLEQHVAAVEVAAEKKKEVPHSLGKELEPRSLGTLYPLDSFLVNISSDQGAKFLQTQMELELGDPAVEEELTRKKAAVRDAVIVLLSSHSYKELREPVGIKKLREELIRSINNLLATGKIKEVYFTQFHFN
jgi:flagellar basal body-associated protein FliL